MRFVSLMSGVSLLSVAMATAGYAQSFTVVDGQTVTTTQTMNGAQDVGVIEAGGAIEITADGGRAIIANGAGAEIVNSGLVTLTGFASRAIVTSGGGTTITNHGVVSTTRGFSSAIIAAGGNNVIENFGTVSTSGNYSTALSGYGDGNTLVNYGTITTGELYAGAMYTDGANSTMSNQGWISSNSEGAYLVMSDGAGTSIVNDGTIVGDADYIRGLSVWGTDSTVTNTGTVSVSKLWSYGVEIQASRVQVSNTGTISAVGSGVIGLATDTYTSDRRITNQGVIVADGENATGIFAGGTGDVVINGGAVTARGANSLAMDFRGAASTLTLLRGASVQGLINYAPDAAVSGTLNVERGVSAALSFSGALPGTINADGMLLAVDPSALKVVTADASSIEVTGTEVDALLDSVFNALGNRAAGSTRAMSSEPLGYYAAAQGPAAFAVAGEAPAGPRAWLNAFGGVSQLELAAGGQASSRIGGLVAGIDIATTPSDTAGLLVGGAMSATSVDGADVTANAGFAGIYGTYRFDQSALDLALLLGATRYSSERTVIDNTVLGGVTTALADYNGYFIAPEIGLGRDLDLGGQTVKVRGALRYAGLFFDGYSETGSAGDLTIAAREAHQLTAKASIAMPFVLFGDAEAVTRLTPRLGIDGSLQVGDQVVSGALAGTPISLDTSSGASARLSAGMQFEHLVSDRWSVIADVEGGMSSNKSLAAQASLEFRLHF
ncbi:autotransporter outer membrane beta-barrel domain-containing protein [Devosia sp.]|uniref:autotransporter outer membrane beta-barrel domain-containing protein n=1 Tax=Devosia sp. TaxID=1871048 RepID=UPI003F71C7A9